LGNWTRWKSGGTLLNQRFTPSLLKSEDDIANLAALIRSYFALGGHHVQFNVVDTKTLRDAQKYPDQYRDLLVRVAGYSDYFNHMDAALQEDVICRTEKPVFLVCAL
jgi:formate C-acetyltransferase